jgi:TPR repeat protein
MYKNGTMQRRPNGIVKPLNRAILPKPRIISAGCIKMARGVVQDDVEAVKWFRKAAEQGYPAAQDNLGWMYKNGRSGFAKPLNKVIPQPKTTLAGCIKMAGVLFRTMVRQ